MSYTLPTGKPCTAKERRAFLIHYARVMLREVQSRRGQKGLDWMLRGAANARREAMSIDLRPKQGVML